MKFISILIACLFMSLSAFAGTCPGKPVAGQVTITTIPHGNLKVVTMPITKRASNELANRTMGTVYEAGDVSPRPQPPSRVQTKRFVHEIAHELHIKVCRIV